MTPTELIERSIFIATEYYRDNIGPWLEYADEGVHLYGPAVGQFLHGRDQMVAVWAQADRSLSFSIGDIQSSCVEANPDVAEVMLAYPLTVHYPDGRTVTLRHRLHFTWVQRRRRGPDGKSQKVPRFLMAHISTPFLARESRGLYPVPYDDMAPSNTFGLVPSQRLQFRGLDRSVYWLHSDMVLWLESSHNGQHAVIHSRDGTRPVMESLSAVERAYPDVFLRIHSGYLVNPDHVVGLRRFMVTMEDGAELPVPEKKYTAVKRALAART